MLKKPISHSSSCPLPPLVSGTTLILGKKGTGKTFLASRMLTMDLQPFQLKQAIAYDPTLSLGRYSDSSYFTANDRTGIHKAFSQNKFPLLIQTDLFDKDLLIYLGLAIWAKGNTLCIFDEGDTVFFQQNVAWLPNEVRRLLTQSRHRNLALVAIVRRPSEVPAGLRALVNRVAVFQTVHEADIAAIEDFIGEHVADDVRTLNRGEFILY